MRYDSFLLRCWRLDGARRIEAAHLQSGEHFRSATLAAATNWIAAQCDETSDGGPAAASEEVTSGEIGSDDGQHGDRFGANDAPSQPRMTYGRNEMPLFMDVHEKVDGVTAADVAAAHAQDIAIQSKYGVNYLKYWLDEGTGRIFCLVEAPSKEAAMAVHRDSHGLVADHIFEVTEGS